MLICGLQKLTLLDFPGITACTVFTGGCDLRCPFCHNRSLVLGVSEQRAVPEEEIFGFLRKRHGLLDGVCVSGGEPTIQPGLAEFLRGARELGFRTKLDTNGTRPDVLGELLSEGLLDYVAMDIKSSPERYPAVTGTENVDTAAVRESAALLMNGKTEFEFRTTVVEELHEPDDFIPVSEWLSGAPLYYLQSFRDSGDIIKPGFTEPGAEKLRRIADILRATIKCVELRGID